VQPIGHEPRPTPNRSSNQEGRLCIRFYRRPDGTVLTRDCPIGLSLRRRALAKSLAAASVVLGALLGIASALGLSQSDEGLIRYFEPFSRLRRFMPRDTVLKGECSIPPKEAIRISLRNM
jgi:hypothetical protein